ncbi:hypothetical protein LSAT2_006519 [Lamellibrachia satsuma]|nr:hypothetical protein LSAT2_006519 [Lamellibrachia satsuma]
MRRRSFTEGPFYRLVRGRQPSRRNTASVPSEARPILAINAQWSPSLSCCHCLSASPQSQARDEVTRCCRARPIFAKDVPGPRCHLALSGIKSTPVVGLVGRHDLAVV